MTLVVTPSPPPATLHTMVCSLDKLVDDVLIQIIQALFVHDIFSLRQTSRRYYLLSKLRCVWYTRFCADVLARNLPPPGPSRPLSLLSATELEQRTLRALYLEQTWPRLSANMLVSRQRHHDDGARVDQVVFIPGGTELLTVQGDKVVHWLIISWPGFTHGLKHIGEYTPFEGVQCRVTKDGTVPGVIAVGPREPLRSHLFAKVLSTGLKAPFVVLCDYARVPGVVVGVWRHLLLLDTSELGRGGLEVLDWHAQTTGTVLLPCFPDLFGSFLDFVVFSGHLLVIWEYGVSVFAIPHVPPDGQVVAEHIRVFVFQEAVSRPVGFTTCVVPSRRELSADLRRETDRDTDWDWDRELEECQSSVLGMSPTLTIAARSRRLTGTVSMVMLIPLVDGAGRETAANASTNTFPYRLALLPPQLPSTSCWQCPIWGGEDDEAGVGDADDHTPGACTVLCLGSSGRGVFVVGRELRLVSPGLHILPPYEMQFGPVLETGPALYRMDRHKQGGTDRLDLNTDSDKVDFDEGMGRFVVARGRGGFDVMQLD